MGTSFPTNPAPVRRAQRAAAQATDRERSAILGLPLVASNLGMGEEPRRRRPLHWVHASERPHGRVRGGSGHWPQASRGHRSLRRREYGCVA